ncbi:MAG: DUF2065 domain-containing protein [Rhodobacteraceae bacterium]|nr:DUF2065 domain-containing protein [Alphaproteobacteria bacterium]MBT8476131.1 DUF2065 domain-containing protein [Alphaproteobacteria bacterium]NNK65143.1 DUF2065 domain-containing protein [Paracoccaceae bacterium]
MAFLLLGLGLVLVIEGLVFALAPSRLDEVLEMLRRIPHDTRRFMGLAAVAIGVVLIWLARSLGL